jgi:hypothetical protein
MRGYEKVQVKWDTVLDMYITPPLRRRSSGSSLCVSVGFHVCVEAETLLFTLCACIRSRVKGGV